MARRVILLISLIPRNGFWWEHKPRVTGSDARDASIVRAFRILLNTGMPTRSRVLPVLGCIFEFLAAEIDTIRGGMGGAITVDNEGQRNYEDIHEFLLRIREEAIRDVPLGRRPYLRLLTLLPADTWVEMVYRFIKAQEDWENEVPRDVRLRLASTLPHLYRCVRRFRNAAEHVWDRDRYTLAAVVDPAGYLEGMAAAGDSVPWADGDWLEWAMEEEDDDDDEDVAMADGDAAAAAGGEATEAGPSAEGAVESARVGISLLDIQSMEVEGADEDDYDVDLYSAEG